MKNWWHQSSNRQKLFVATLLLIGVNCFTWFGLGFISRLLFILPFVTLGLAAVLPSDYEE